MFEFINYCFDIKYFYYLAIEVSLCISTLRWALDRLLLSLLR
ncbi:hypothetical protein A1OE_101 [Candidatus Endolissoclinum faulkneri L2]|uniref:Uncharacterized protein n=1 Tax=Candidatus Endolissoclinum faulkneri L2 TaxID=1193729 RepID=K7YLE6_9PROT|nr:hypothetical protein A1OE_101 [Candidatus Endolissoclinum faulkneri L2]